MDGFKLPAPRAAPRRFALGKAPDKTLVRKVSSKPADSDVEDAAAAAGSVASMDPSANAPKLQYTPPGWSAAPSGRVRVTGVRNGVPLEPIDISGRGYAVVGRLPTCDVSLESVAVSRLHAVLQHRGDEGVYVYDLGSAHGTFINRSHSPIAPRTWVPLLPGQLVRFGTSPSMYLVECSGSSSGGRGSASGHEDVAAIQEAGAAAAARLRQQHAAATTAPTAARGAEPERAARRRREEAEERQLAMQPRKKARLGGAPEHAAQGGEGGQGEDEEDQEDPHLAEERRREERAMWAAIDSDDEAETLRDQTQSSSAGSMSRRSLTAISDRETFQSLSDKLAIVRVQRLDIEQKIQTESQVSARDAGQDDVDAYVAKIEESARQERLRKLHLELEDVRKHTARLQRLLDVAKPDTLPAPAHQVGATDASARASTPSAAAAQSAAAAAVAGGGQGSLARALQRGKQLEASKAAEDEAREAKQAAEARAKALRDVDTILPDAFVAANVRVDSAPSSAASGTRLIPEHTIVLGRPPSPIARRVRGVRRDADDAGPREHVLLQRPRQFGPARPDDELLGLGDGGVEADRRDHDRDAIPSVAAAWVAPAGQTGDGTTAKNRELGY